MNNMKLYWGWCELCEGAFVRCPKCGNNSCNGGYGEIDGVKCDICPIAYQYQDLAYKTYTAPKTKKDVSKINAGIT